MRQVDLAALFMVKDPQWVKPVRTLGWWILLCPPVGWLIALGYRKEVVLHFTRSNVGPLPVWPGVYHLFCEGVKALGVISCYLAPVLILSWHWGADQGWHDMVGGVTYGLWSLSLVPLTLPATPLFYMINCDNYMLSPIQGMTLFIISASSTFMIPAGFMRVALRGSFSDALYLPSVFTMLFNYWRPYLRAWWDSLRLSIAGLSMIVFAPWGIAWSYLGIVLCFNQILAQSLEEKDAQPYETGWLKQEKSSYECMIELIIDRLRRNQDTISSVDVQPELDPNQYLSFIRIWGIYVPFPKPLSKLLFLTRNS